MARQIPWYDEGTGACGRMDAPCVSSALTVLKFASPPTFAAAGDSIDYTYTIINHGPFDVNNITLSDDVATVAGGTLATLAAGATDTATFTATYVVTAADVTRGYIHNTATASGTDTAGNNVSGFGNASTSLSAQAEPPCADVLASLDGQANREYIRTAGRLLDANGSTAEVTSPSGWNIAAGTQQGGHTILTAAGWDAAMTGLSSGRPTLNATIKGYAGTVGSGTAEIVINTNALVTNLSHVSASNNGEIWINTGSIYAGCGISDPTQLEFRLNHDGTIRASEMRAYFWLGGSYQANPGASSTHDVYYLAESGTIIQQTVASMMVSPGDQIGFVYASLDSALNHGGQLEFRLGGAGAWTRLETPADFTVVGFGLNST